MRLRIIIFLTILTFCVFGCGQDDHIIGNSTARLNIEFHLAPGAAIPNINRIDITVSAPDMDKPISFPPIERKDIDYEGKTAKSKANVPIGKDRRFYATAFDENNVAIFNGFTNVDITPDKDTTVLIEFSQQIIIGIQPNQNQLKVGDEYTLDIHINDVLELFAFTCELEFDENLLTPVGATPGEFFGSKDDILFIEDSTFPKRQQNHLSLMITRKAGAAGVLGSGVAFQVTFKAISKGSTSITLLRNSMLKLTSPDFKQIEDSRIIIEPSVPVKIEQILS